MQPRKSSYLETKVKAQQCSISHHYSPTRQCQYTHVCSLTHAFHSVHAAWKRGGSGLEIRTHIHTRRNERNGKGRHTTCVCVRQEREREKVPFFNSGSMGGRALTSSSKQKRKIRKKEEKGSLQYLHWLLYRLKTLNITICIKENLPVRLKLKMS